MCSMPCAQSANEPLVTRMQLENVRRARHPNRSLGFFILFLRLGDAGEAKRLASGIFVHLFFNAAKKIHCLSQQHEFYNADAP